MKNLKSKVFEPKMDIETNYCNEVHIKIRKELFLAFITSGGFLQDIRGISDILIESIKKDLLMNSIGDSVREDIEK